MKTIEHKGRSMSFYPMHGEVVKIYDNTTTTVSGYGGGSYRTMEGQAAIHPVTISSQTTYEREIWIKDANDKEHAIMLNDKSVKVREGNPITFGIAEKNNSRSLISLKNHATDKQYQLSSPESIVDSYQLAEYPHWMELIMWVVFAIVAGGVAGFATGSFFTILPSFMRTGTISDVLFFIFLGVTLAVFIAIFRFGYGRYARKIRNYKLAVVKVEEARKSIMAKEHPGLS